jgi:hypothetical protein
MQGSSALRLGKRPGDLELSLVVLSGTPLNGNPVLVFAGGDALGLDLNRSWKKSLALRGGEVVARSGVQKILLSELLALLQALPKLFHSLLESVLAFLGICPKPVEDGRYAS